MDPCWTSAADTASMTAQEPLAAAAERGEAAYRHGHAAREHGRVHAHGPRALRGPGHAVGAGRGPVEALGAEAASLGEHAGHGGLWRAPGGLQGLHLGQALGVLLLQLLLPHLCGTL